MEYDVIFEVRTKKLTEGEKQNLRDAMLEALDKAGLPYSADVVTASVMER